MKTNWLTEMAAALLILLFAYTGISKAAHLSQLVITLRLSFGRLLYDVLWAYLLVGAELLTVLLLLIPYTRTAGFLLSCFLMTMFLLYTVYGWLYPHGMPCSCGGVISGFSWPAHVVFNSFFWLVAFYGSLSSIKKNFKRFIAINRF
jgi:putative oxidoreductase